MNFHKITCVAQIKTIQIRLGLKQIETLDWALSMAMRNSMEEDAYLSLEKLIDSIQKQTAKAKLRHLKKKLP